MMKMSLQDAYAYLKNAWKKVSFSITHYDFLVNGSVTFPLLLYIQQNKKFEVEAITDQDSHVVFSLIMIMFSKSW